jgi:beta-lactamase regulating signal transducer with metallopeptidase domain
MNLYAIARFAANGIVTSLMAGVAIAALAWVFIQVVRREGSGTRFAVWYFALISIVVFPWVGSVVAASRPTAPALATGTLTLPASVGFYLFIVWMIGATLGLAHVAHGLYQLRRLRATCAQVDLNQLDPALQAVLADAQNHRRVTLCVSDSVRVPAAIGYFRPMVVFPAWALAEIGPAELKAILVHELAHLRRYDDWTNLAQKVAKAIFFFHPAVWFIESRLTLEREMACDAAVLAASFSPRAYAESLVGLAEKSFLRRGVRLAQAAVGHVQQLKLRLAEILRNDKDGKSRQGSAGVCRAAIAIMSLAAVVATFGVSRAPHLVAFSNYNTVAATVRPASPAPEFQLQPVNLRYTEGPLLVNPQIRNLELPRTHKLQRAAASRRLALAQRTASSSIDTDAAARAMMVLGNFPLDVSAPAPVWVVFQGEQFSPDGPIFWRVTIIHLTAAQERALTGGVPKQI